MAAKNRKYTNSTYICGAVNSTKTIMDCVLLDGKVKKHAKKIQVDRILPHFAEFCFADATKCYGDG